MVIKGKNASAGCIFDGLGAYYANQNVISVNFALESGGVLPNTSMVYFVYAIQGRTRYEIFLSK
jgi:hypothetical protein